MRAVLTAALAFALSLGQPTSPVWLTSSAPLIYSEHANDSWNRLFGLLFTRTVRSRFTSEFTDCGPFDVAISPFTMFADLQPLHTSMRTFERFEDGDRAIDALYPAFLNQTGPREALVDPLHGQLFNTLNAALDDRTERSPLARALMQTDLWSAYDLLAAIQGGGDYPARRAAAGVTASLAKLMARLALTPAEIAALPDNYEDARRGLPLPDLFHSQSGWIEIVRNPNRMHDAHEQLRRAARVFVRPTTPPRDPAAFLKALTAGEEPGPISATALIVQALTLDASSHVLPTPLISDVQIRTFTRDARGGLSASMTEYELSRRRLLSSPSTGGFLQFSDGSEAYLASSGNDYGFATPTFGDPHKPEPTIGTLHARCVACHGGDGSLMMSLAVQDPSRAPATRALSQPNEERARYVAQRKEAREDFKRLIALTGLR